MKRLVGMLVAVLMIAPATTRLRAQSVENIVVVVNTSSAESVRIGEHYARKRGIPQDNLLRLKLDPELGDEIGREQYERWIKGPLAAWFARTAAHDRILYLVLTKGIPLRVSGSTGLGGTIASVDSELSLLYRELTGLAVPPAGRIPNPYFLGESPTAQARPFTHEAYDIFLITRLDGFTVDDVLGLIDRGVAPVPGGTILLDQKAAWLDTGNTWLRVAAERLRARGFDRVRLESTGEVVTGASEVLGYYSWGSNDPAIQTRRFGFGFVPGALAAMFVSTDGRTFREPPPEWKLGTWTDRRTLFQGSPQSLAGDLIREGVTGIAAHVAEPYLDGTIRPDILFPAYLAGFNLVESFYLAMPYLSWQTVVVGDPLCAPFRGRALEPAKIDAGLDPVTELPVFFSAKRLQALAAGGNRPDALRLVLRAEARLARRDSAGARDALEEATSLDERLLAPRLLLGALYEEAAEHDKAIDQYRRVLAATPNDPVGLNNLAYALAVHRGEAAEALPLARKAYALSKQDPNVADTLGWIHHLLGDHAQARGFLRAALERAPELAEAWLHAAVVHAALGELEPAFSSLKRALELKPELAARSEAEELQMKLRSRAR